MKCISIVLTRWLVVSLLICTVQPLRADAPIQIVTDTIVNLPIDKAWGLFTTAEGWSSMGYDKVTMELRRQGQIVAEAPATTTTSPSPASVHAFITTYEPQHLLAFEWQGAANDWSLLYFQALGTEMTGLRWVEFSTVSEQQPAARAKAHRELFDRLVKRYTIECHVCREERELREAEPASRH